MSDRNSAVRYGVRLGLKPGDRVAEYAVVTSMGELKAAVLASLRHSGLEPDVRIFSVEIVRVERDFTIDSEHDLLDYWEVG